jgi:hypothetical protein
MQEERSRVWFLRRLACVSRGMLGSARFGCTGLLIIWSSCGCLDLWSISPHTAGDCCDSKGRERGVSDCLLMDASGLSFITLVSCNFVRIPSDLPVSGCDGFAIFNWTLCLFWTSHICFAFG